MHFAFYTSLFGIICMVATRYASPFEIMLPICQSVGTKEGVFAYSRLHSSI